MPDIEKRLHYFKGQFLKAEDFIDEQKYHSDRLERHTRFLHSPGVANGLEVKGDINTAQVTVTSGTAIDGNGKQIVLIADRAVRVDRDELKGKEALIVISYGEVKSDPADVGAKENTRWHEVPNVTAVLATENPSETQFIRLASVSVNAQGNLVEKPKDLRQKAGQPAIADGSIGEIKLDLAVRNKLIGGATGTTRISHSALNLDGGTNPHGTTATDVKALPIAGGALTGRFRVQTNAPGTVAATGTPVISGLGSAFVLNTASNSYALIAKVSDTPDVLPNSGVAIPAAALAAISGFDGSHGIYTTAKAGTHALRVDGTAQLNGSLQLTGPLNFTSATTPMMFIFPGGGNDAAVPRRAIAAHSPANLDWGLVYDDPADAMIYQQNAATPIMTVNLGQRSVGIGATAITPAFTLEVIGTAGKPGGGAWSATSDRRLKQNIQPLQSVLAKLLNLQGVSFEWKDPARQGNLTGTQIGMIAQDVEQVFPEWVDTSSDGYKILTFRGFEALTVEALRELKAENDQLKATCRSLEARLAALEAHFNGAIAPTIVS
jgi:Chaperone of endosialidase